MSFTITGDDDTIRKLSKLGNDSVEVFRFSLYKGAGKVADSIKQSMNGIPVDNRTYGTPDDPLNGITAKQKADCIAALGISQFQGEDTIDTSIGFDGYTVNANNGTSKKYPKGIPIPMLMRSLESGTSFRTAHPVIRNAANKAKVEAVEAMQQELNKQIDERFGG